ncbi:hypothetical protein [Umezawaea sp. Da 62-37]|uniref:hypothetical protein n=1 Tax=Umezawaea sp. Da 62-37 TaxID=3075927 RepID=UPI0037DC0250
MVAGILRRDAGGALVECVIVSTRTTEHKGRIGCVPQELTPYPDLTGRENPAVRGERSKALRPLAHRSVRRHRRKALVREDLRPCRRFPDSRRVGA